MQTTGKIVVLYNLIFMFLDSKWEDKSFLIEWWQALAEFSLLSIFSNIWRKQKFWSVVHLLCRNPHWWSPIISSMYGQYMLNFRRQVRQQIWARMMSLYVLYPSVKVLQKQLKLNTIFSTLWPNIWLILVGIRRGGAVSPRLKATRARSLIYFNTISFKNVEKVVCFQKFMKIWEK
jgi:hypothetical protein